MFIPYLLFFYIIRTQPNLKIVLKKFNVVYTKFESLTFALTKFINFVLILSKQAEFVLSLLQLNFSYYIKGISISFIYSFKTAYKLKKNIRTKYIF